MFSDWCLFELHRVLSPFQLDLQGPDSFATKQIAADVT